MSDVKEEIPMEENPKDIDGLLAWVKAHRKQLILIGISIPTVIAVALILKNRETIKSMWVSLNEEIKKVSLYSTKWFETVSDDILNAEREKVRQSFCSSGGDIAEADRLQKLLWRFDEELRKRAWGDEIPHAPSISREHGWYLPNDD